MAECQPNICRTTSTALPFPDYPSNAYGRQRLEQSAQYPHPHPKGTSSSISIIETIISEYQTNICYTTSTTLPSPHRHCPSNGQHRPRLDMSAIRPQGGIVLNFHHRDDHIRIPNKHLLYNINNTSLPTQTLPVQRSAQAKAGHVCNTSPRGHRPLS